MGRIAFAGRLRAAELAHPVARKAHGQADAVEHQQHPQQRPVTRIGWVVALDVGREGDEPLVRVWQPPAREVRERRLQHHHVGEEEERQRGALVGGREGRRGGGRRRQRCAGRQVGRVHARGEARLVLGWRVEERLPVLDRREPARGGGGRGKGSAPAPRALRAIGEAELREADERGDDARERLAVQVERQDASAKSSRALAAAKAEEGGNEGGCGHEVGDGAQEDQAELRRVRGDARGGRGASDMEPEHKEPAGQEGEGGIGRRGAGALDARAEHLVHARLAPIAQRVGRGGRGTVRGTGTAGSAAAGRARDRCVARAAARRGAVAVKPRAVGGGRVGRVVAGGE